MPDCEKVIDALRNAVVDGGVVKMSTEVRDIVIECLKESMARHGHWKGFTQSRFYGMKYGEPVFRDGRFYVCSECRRRTVIKTQYCPRCGAKMDGEVEQDG